MARTGALFALGLVLPALAVASPPQTAEEAVAAVEAKYAGVDVMSAQFTQTVHNPLFGDDVQSGEVVLARPTKMRWTFGEGEREFVTDGSTMWVYSRADNQVIQYAGFTPSAGGAESLLSSLDTLDEIFDVQLVSSTPTVLTLTPHDQGMFKQVRLTLDAELVVDEVVITDLQDNTTELDFADMQLNTPAPDSLFAFEAPEGATVIDAGTM